MAKQSDVKRKYDRHGNSRPVQSREDEVNAVYNGFVFDKAPTAKQAEQVSTQLGTDKPAA